MTDSDDKTRTLICPHCDKAAEATVRGLAVANSVSTAGAEPALPTEFAMIQCTRCQLPSIQVREDRGRGFDSDDPTVLFPAPRRLSQEVPRPLRQEWEEAQSCFRNKLYTATAVMVRRTVEGVAKQQGVTERTLAESMRKLRSLGRIDSTLSSWADGLKVISSQSPHLADTTVSRQDAEDALSFAEAVLDHIYVLRRRFDEFQSRRSTVAAV
jgi:endogenous inhibitor of DNA gyrase (YacG/DUF329 family)